MEDLKKKNKMICPRCTGNGYVRIPNQAVGNPKEIISQCTMCGSEGEIDDSVITYKLHIQSTVW